MTQPQVPYLEGVLAQPDNLERSRAVVAESLRAPLPSRFTDPDATLLLVGMGASLHACHPSVAVLRASGRRAWAVSPTEVLAGPPAAALGDAVVAVSQSGRSAETVAAMDALSSLPSVGVCNDAGSPLGVRVGSVVAMGSQPDTPVSTLTYTAGLQALGMLCEHLVRESAPGGPDGREPAADWAGLPGLARQVLERSHDTARAVGERWCASGSVDVVAGVPGLASAAESALLLREAAHVPAAATDTLQYLHGPLEVAEPGRAALVLGDGREVALARSLAEYGCDVLLVTTVDVPTEGGLTVLRLPPLPPVARGVVEVLPIQLLTWYLARARGLDVTGFRHHQDDTKLPA